MVSARKALKSESERRGTVFTLGKPLRPFWQWNARCLVYPEESDELREDLAGRALDELVSDIGEL